VIRVVEVDEDQTLEGAAARFVQELQRVGWLSPDYTQTETTLGGQPALLLEGPGEYTRLHVLLAVHEGKRYTLSLWPDPEQYPLVASDMAALRETMRASFSFLSHEPAVKPPVRELAAAPDRFVGR
jgi:hypothetical protein